MHRLRIGGGKLRISPALSSIPTTTSATTTAGSTGCRSTLARTATIISSAALAACGQDPPVILVVANCRHVPVNSEDPDCSM